MNETQVLILEFINRYRQERNGLSPTYSEIQRAVGLRSKSTVNYNVTQLILMGKLIRDGRFRGLVPVNDQEEKTNE